MSALTRRPKDVDAKVGDHGLANAKAIDQKSEVQKSEDQRGLEFKSRSLGIAGSRPELENK